MSGSPAFDGGSEIQNEPRIQGLRHRGEGRGDASPIFESAEDNPPIFRKIVGQIR